MTYYTSLRAALLSTALLLGTGLGAHAAERSVDLPDLAPERIAADVTIQTNPRTGLREAIAPTFDPFEADPGMAGSVALRSARQETTIDGQIVSGGAMLDLGFYYNSPSNDPYGGRGYSDVAYLSGGLAPVVKRDTRILECSSNVRNVVYDHTTYYRPTVSFSFYRPSRHYRGYHTYGIWDRPYWRRGYRGGYSRDRWRRRTGSGHGYGWRDDVRRRRDRDGDDVRRRRPRDGDEVRRRRDRDGDEVRRRRDRDGDEVRRRRDRDGDDVRRPRRPRDGDDVRRPRRPNDGGRTGRRDVDSGKSKDSRVVYRRTPTNLREATGTSRPKKRRRNGSDGAVTQPDRRRVADTSRRPRVDRRPDRPAVSRPRVERKSTPTVSRPTPRPQPKPKPRSQPKPKPRSQPKRTSKPVMRKPSKGANWDFFPGDYYGGREVVTTTTSLDCAREDKVSVFIPNERLDAARFDGLTVLALDRTGQEYPVYLPPNYIEGFRTAVRRNGIGGVTYSQPTYSQPTYSEPRYVEPTRVEPTQPYRSYPQQ